MSKSPGSAPHPRPWGLTMIGAFKNKASKVLNIVVYISTGLKSSLSGAELVDRYVLERPYNYNNLIVNMILIMFRMQHHPSSVQSYNEY